MRRKKTKYTNDLYVYYISLSSIYTIKRIIFISYVIGVFYCYMHEDSVPYTGRGKGRKKQKKEKKAKFIKTIGLCVARTLPHTHLLPPVPFSSPI